MSKKEPLILALNDQRNWKPDFVRLAKATGMPKTTIYSRIKKWWENKEIELEIKLKFNPREK